MSTTTTNKQLHWTQRVALVRHNLHVASRSGDFSFFKTLQAAGLMEGTNHVATLSASLGDEADTVLAAMDNLNAGLAYVHQDAFKNVYDNLKDSMREDNKEADKSKLYVDIAMQRNMADMSIDKMSGSAIVLTNSQPAHVQDQVANVWISGATLVADCIDISLREIDELEYKLDDFIRLEESWNTVKASVVGAVTGLRGIFSLMDPSPPQSDKASVRSSSIASMGGAVLRRMSNALQSGSPPQSRTASVASSAGNLTSYVRNSSVSSLTNFRSANFVRNSVSTGCPTSMPAAGHKLSTIPPTPAAQEELIDPFDTSFDFSVPPVPEIPTLPAPVAIEQQRRLSQIVM